jgi:hypothetical protein
MELFCYPLHIVLFIPDEFHMRKKRYVEAAERKEDMKSLFFETD